MDIEKIIALEIISMNWDFTTDSQHSKIVFPFLQRGGEIGKPEISA